MITRKYLRDHPEHIFVFGDNELRRGKKGAARLRDERNVWGFVTKKKPGGKDADYFRVEEYWRVFEREKKRLLEKAEENPGRVYLVSKVGSRLANRFGIWENVIEPGFMGVHRHNIIFLWKL